MNFLEILLFILLVISGILWRKKHQKVLFALVIGQLILISYQVWMNGFRWPMIPLFMLTIYFTLRIPFINKTVQRMRTKLAFVVILLFSVLLPGYLFPWNTVVEPTGDYDVGTQSFEVVDDHRIEQWTTNKGPRRLMVQLWYPTEDREKRDKANYHEDPVLFMKEFGEANGIPGFLLQSFAKQKVPAYKEASIVDREDPYPIIFFSHGLGGNRGQNHFQFLELASHGYIVVGIDHTYYSPGTVFPSGEKPGLGNMEFSEDVNVMNEYVYEWSADAQSVLNWIQEVNKGNQEGWLNQMKGRFDLERVGYLGHSFGGAAASHTLAVDDRFHAGINMDGFPYGQAPEIGINKPFLTLLSDKSLMSSYIDDKEYLNQYYQRVDSVSGSENVIQIRGAMHYDFSDMLLLSPITSWVGMTGNVSPKEQHEEINKITLNFYKRHLVVH